MAEQTIALPAAAHKASDNRREWIWSNRFDDPRIDDSLTSSGNPARYIINLRLYKAGSGPTDERIVILHLEPSASRIAFSTGSDLSAEFEARGSLVITVGNVSLQAFQRLSGDTVEQYRYDIGEPYTVEQFDALFAAMGPPTGSVAGTLVIRDFEPGPSVGGSAFGGRKLSGAAFGGRKLTGAAFGGRKLQF